MTINPVPDVRFTPGPSVMSHVIKLQLAAAIMLALVVWYVDPAGLRSLLYGEMVAIAGSVWMWQRARGLAKLDSTAAHTSLRYLQITSAGRFVVAASLLALPMLHRHAWHVEWVVGGFIAGHLVAMGATAWQHLSGNRIPTQD